MKKTTKKISFKSITDVLSRNEMKRIMAGSGDCPTIAQIMECHEYCWGLYAGEANNPLYNHCMFCCKAGKCGSMCA